MEVMRYPVKLPTVPLWATQPQNTSTVTGQGKPMPGAAGWTRLFLMPQPVRCTAWRWCWVARNGK